MKDFKKLNYGKEYADKMREETIQIEAVKAAYAGDFDVKNERMITVSYGNRMNPPAIMIDDNVPEDLKASLLEAFYSVWK